MGVRISPWSLRCRWAGAQPALMRPARPDRYRDLQLNTCCGWAKAHPGPISLDRRVRPPDPLLDCGRVRKQAKRRGRESRDFAGSIPASVTTAIPWSSGQDAWVTSRKPMVRIHPGSLKRRSVGVVVARRRGKAEDRVRVPDGPLERRAAHSTVGRLVCTQAIGVRLLGGPLENTGSWSKGKTPPWRGGDPSSTLGGSTATNGR